MSVFGLVSQLERFDYETCITRKRRESIFILATPYTVLPTIRQKRILPREQGFSVYVLMNRSKQYVVVYLYLWERPKLIIKSILFSTLIFTTTKR